MDGRTETRLVETTDQAAADEVALPPEVEILPSDGFLTRQAEYLEFCFEHNGPGQGGIHGQVCRAAKGGPTFNKDSIDAACDKVNNREDCADFVAASLLRLLYLDRKNGALSEETRKQIEQALLGFKYWLSEPGDDKMCFWSENHQALFHSAELLAGQLFPDELFPNAGMTGNEHLAHAAPLVERWLDERGRFGFSEWHSNVYFNEDMPALLNLADFAENKTIRLKAKMVLDILAMDMLNNYYKGHFACPHGRTYPNKLLDGLKDSTTEALWILVGLGEYASAGNFSGAFLATSTDYWPPEILEEIAVATVENHEHRQRDGINITDGPKWGIGYEDFDDIIFWAGMVALVAPEVINGTVAMLDAWDLWDGFLFGDLPPEIMSLLEPLAGTPELVQLSEELEAASRGIALESMSTYTFRTPHYQLSGAQDYNPGWWAAQTLMWQATLDDQAYLFTTCPSSSGDIDTGLQFAGEWIGSWMPRITLHKNVGVIQYEREKAPLLEQYFSADYTHAYFPKNRFDEVEESGNWVMGRKGDAYVALYSENPVAWSADNDYELIADAPANVWIVELGSVEENGSFGDFSAAFSQAIVDIGDSVKYQSPAVGLVEVGWEGPMVVDGNEIDIGPYPRWDNEFVTQEFGKAKCLVTYGETTLELDFGLARRRLTIGE